MKTSYLLPAVHSDPVTGSVVVYSTRLKSLFAFGIKLIKSVTSGLTNTASLSVSHQHMTRIC